MQLQCPRFFLRGYDSFSLDNRYFFKNPGSISHSTKQEASLQKHPYFVRLLHALSLNRASVAVHAAPPDLGKIIAIL
jgi:hypothetical protein